MNLDLATFSMSLWSLSHSATLARSSFGIYCKSVVDFAEQYKAVSSADNESDVCFRHVGKSLIKIEKRSGPRIDPCGTPTETHLLQEVA